MDFAWAANYPDLYNVCEKFNLVEINNPEQVRYTPCEGMIQDGPQCGLVALAIFMQSPTKETVDELLKVAKERGYTFNGEMFSAKDMLELTKQYVANKVTLHEGHLHANEIKQFLLEGGQMLVPYDCDRNHTPCKWQGHKAHWAIIIGIISASSTTYVLARHGKSRNIAIWNLMDLSQSNAQLDEFSSDRKLHDVLYKLPEGGLGGPSGLKCKAVCIWPNVNS